MGCGILFLVPQFLGGWDGGLFIFVEDEVSEVFNGVLVYIFHEGSDGVFWDFKVE